MFGAVVEPAVTDDPLPPAQLPTSAPPPPAVSPPPPVTPLTQHVSDAAQAGVVAGAIDGNVNVFLQHAGVPTPTPEQQEVVRAYLTQLEQKDDRLRLFGFAPGSRSDAHAARLVTLSQVYVWWCPLGSHGCRDFNHPTSEVP